MPKSEEKTMLVEVENLYKKYTNKGEYAIEDISLCGAEGEVIGILGHNGAGKSTTIKCMTGIHPYQKGSVKICGFDVQNSAINAKSNFGYVTDEFALFDKMTGYEYINFLADIYKVSLERTLYPLCGRCPAGMVPLPALLLPGAQLLLAFLCAGAEAPLLHGLPDAGCLE